MGASTSEASQTPKLYDHPGAKKNVWKYFGYLKYQHFGTHVL